MALDVDLPKVNDPDGIVFTLPCTFMIKEVILRMCADSLDAVKEQVRVEPASEAIITAIIRVQKRYLEI